MATRQRTLTPKCCNNDSPVAAWKNRPWNTAHTAIGSQLRSAKTTARRATPRPSAGARWSACCQRRNGSLSRGENLDVCSSGNGTTFGVPITGERCNGESTAHVGDRLRVTTVNSWLVVTTRGGYNKWSKPLAISFHTIRKIAFDFA